jgi:hypothetical protein
MHIFTVKSKEVDIWPPFQRTDCIFVKEYPHPAMQSLLGTDRDLESSQDSSIIVLYCQVIKVVEAGSTNPNVFACCLRGRRLHERKRKHSHVLVLLEFSRRKRMTNFGTVS